MPPAHKSSGTIEDDALIDDLVGFVEDLTTKELYFYQKWNFQANPFEHRSFEGDRSSVQTRRQISIKKLLEALIRSYNAFDHILLKGATGAGKSFLLQEFYAALTTPRLNQSLVQSFRELPTTTCRVAMIDGAEYADRDTTKRIEYLVEAGVIDEQENPCSDIVIIDNFASLQSFWQNLYDRYLPNAFIIASIQTAELVYLKALQSNKEVPFRQVDIQPTTIALPTSDPLDQFTREIEIPSWSQSELVDLLKIRIQLANPTDGLNYFTEEILAEISQRSLGLPGLCLDLAQETFKRAINKDLQGIRDLSQLEALVDPNFAKASTILAAFLQRDDERKLRIFPEEIQSVVTQLTKKTRKELIRFLLVSLGGYHVHTRQAWRVGTAVEDYFSPNETTKATLLAKSLSPSQLAVYLEKKQSTLSYHLNWFQEKEMLSIITSSSIPALRTGQVHPTGDKIVLPPTPFAQLFEIILSQNPS